MSRDPSKAPLLIDRFIHASNPPGRYITDPRITQNVKRGLINARTFVLDERAAVRLGQVIRDIPELIVKHQAFARPLFDRMWIEYPFTPYWEELHQDEADATSDARLGYFFDHGRVYTVAGGQKGAPGFTPALSPVRYHLHEPWTLEQQLELTQNTKTSRLALDAFFWGESWSKVDEEIRRGLRNEHSMDLMIRSEIKDSELPHIFRKLMNGSAGELRTIVSLLLLMNRPSLTRYVHDVPRRRGVVGGKIRPFMAHTLVSIDLDPVPQLRKLGTKEEDDHGLRRRHEVRGHYCHNEAYRVGTANGCEHEFEPDTEATHPEDSWRCKLCRGKRWWRAHHARGTAEVGLTMKTYEVTSNTIP